MTGSTEEDDEPYEHREHDHLVEPMWGGFGLHHTNHDAESGEGAESGGAVGTEAAGVGAAEADANAKDVPDLGRVGAIVRWALLRWRRGGGT